MQAQSPTNADISLFRGPAMVARPRETSPSPAPAKRQRAPQAPAKFSTTLDTVAFMLICCFASTRVFRFLRENSRFYWIDMNFRLHVSDNSFDTIKLFAIGIRFFLQIVIIVPTIESITSYRIVCSGKKHRRFKYGSYVAERG